ncbi:hypothetical protein D3C78_1854040 [compost metagenome]
MESPAHLDFLQGEECHYAQGFWLSRPRPPAALEPLLRGEEGFEGEACLPAGAGRPHAHNQGSNR